MRDYKKCCFQMECFILYVIIYSDRLGMLNLKGNLDKYFSKHSFIPYRPYVGVREYSRCRKLPPKIVIIVSPTIKPKATRFYIFSVGAQWLSGRVLG